MDQKLSLLFESNPLPAIEWDTDFRIVAWNQAATKVFGFTKEEAIGRHAAELIILRELRDLVDNIFQSLLQQTGGSNSINENITKTRETITCDWHNNVLVDNQGQVTGVLSIIQNVTAQKQTEEFLWEQEEKIYQSEKRYQVLAEASPICVFYTDTQGNCIYTNDRWQDIAGLTKEEALGRGWSQNVHPEDKEQLFAEWGRSVATQQPFRLEYRFQLSDGTITWVISQAMSVKDEAKDGAVIGYVGTITNITDAKIAEAQLRESEKRFQALTEAKLLETQSFLESVLTNLPVAVFAKDAQDLNFILCNPAGEKVLKMKAEHILGKNDYDLFPPEQADVFTQMDREALNSPEVIDIPEELAQDGQGMTRIFHTKKTAVLDGEGVPQSLLIITEDITERKAAEQQLKEQAVILQAFVDHTPVPIAMYDKEMRYLVVNQCWLADYNFVGQDIIGRSHYDVFPNIPDRWKEVHQRCLAGATESHEADPFPRIDGSIDYIRWQILPWRNAQGEIGGILAYSEMITERVKAEEERRNLAAIVSNANDFIGIASLEGKLLYTNPAGLALLGLESLELARTKEVIDLFVPRESEAVLQIINTEIMPKGRWQGERTFQHFVTGEEIPAHANTFLVNDPITNQPLYIAAIIRDIRAEKAAEQQLQKKADREELLNRINNKIRSSLDFNEILEKAVTEIRSFLNVDYCSVSKYLPPLEDQVAYWEVLAESKIPGIPDAPQKYPTSTAGAISERLLNLEIVQIDDTETCNDLEVKNILQLFGISSLTIIPSLLSNSVFVSFSCVNYQQPRQWLEDEVELLEAVMEQLAIALNQAELYQKAESRAQELEEILRELQRTQGQLVQSEKMSSLGQLVAGVAHEINNPVNFIYGNLSHVSEYSQDLIRLLELYQKYYPTPVAEIEAEAEAVDLEFLLTDLPPMLSSMKVGADRIKEIVLSLRNFSRMDEAGMKAVDIHSGIDSTLMILQSRLKVKSNQPEIPVIKNYGDLPLVVCYAGELNQVFMNIITNAIDALEERDQQRTFSECQQNPSQIYINTNLLPNKQVEIEIGDNGLGIPESVQKRLFDPFFTTKEIGKGTGLGMSISYQIVTERHHGSLSCKSQPGRGASFIIRIPLQQINLV